MSDNNNNLVGEVFGEQSVIGSLGVDVKIIYRGYTAYIDELYVDDDGDLIIALTNSQGESTTVSAGHVEGEQGEPGYAFIPSVSDAGVISWTNAGGLPNPDPKNIKGQTGDTGRGITSITLTLGDHSPGTLDTYTIAYSDNTTSTFLVYNGADGVSPTANVVQTPNGARITVTDKSGTTTVDLPNGYHIGDVQLTSGSTLPGQTATYTMYLNDDEETPVGSFNVYNGADGEGVGDMTKVVYDANNDGVVDNASALGGHPASYFAVAGDIPTVPTNVSAFTNDAGYITITAITNKADLVNGKIPEGQLPSYVDDVMEYDSESDFPVEGESGKIYISIETNKTYRWGGTEYVATNSALALGETSSTAYRGDRGKIAYEHSQITQGNPHGTTAAEVGAIAIPFTATAFPSSSTALAENTIYTIPSSAPVGTYEFVPPATGWAHGTFSTGSSVNITFATGSKFYGEAPTFEASTEYEFDVNGDIWVFGEVVTS